MAVLTTLKDIAKEANCTPATVSMVLNHSGRISDATRERVLCIAKKYNYRPNNIAKALKVKKSSTIGILVEDIKYFYVPGLIDVINTYCEDLNYSIILGNLCLDRKIGIHYENAINYKAKINECFLALASKQIDGAIYIGGAARDLSGLIDTTIPIVYVYAFSNDPNSLSILYDDEMAAFHATSFLINYGHVKIGMLGGPEEWYHQQERLHGFKRALLEHRIPFCSELVECGDWSMESGYKCAKKMLANNPTAIFSANDTMAAGVYAAARGCSVRIPEDLSVIGFDNMEICKLLDPPLSTMSLPIQAMATLCAQQIIDMIKNDEVESAVPANIIRLPCELVIRQSVEKIN